MTIRNDYKTFSRFERLYARREVGYDPENGVFVDVKHNGIIENVDIDNRSYWAMNPRAADAARRSMYRRNDKLDVGFGTIVEAQAMRRDEHHFLNLLDIGVEALFAYQSARRTGL